jgi:hypothetical protein
VLHYIPTYTIILVIVRGKAVGTLARIQMGDRVFCFDSMHRQQMFLFSSAFRPDVELYRPPPNQVRPRNARGTNTCSSTNMPRYVYWGQPLLPSVKNVLKKQLYMVIKVNLITSCKKMFSYLHICRYCTDCKLITATILNSLSVKH